jgi:hypothetical protein
MRDLDTINSKLRLLAAVGTRGGGGGGGLVEWLQTGRWAAARHQWFDTSPPAPGICMQRHAAAPGTAGAACAAGLGQGVAVDLDEFIDVVGCLMW